MKTLITLIAMLLALNSFSQQKAFPSAYGAGAYTTGGRGGIVYHVTNLNNSGAGSLRNGLEMTVPRTIVFDVSGVIQLNSILTLYAVNSNFTIAGQTAPEGGITIDGSRVYFNGVDNLICRYIRFKGGIDNNNDSFSSVEKATNQIFDHCSFAFGVDEAASWYVTGNGDEVDNITIQRCFFAESSTGSIIGGQSGVGSITGDLSFINNLFYNIKHRFPNIAGDNANIDVINNVAWNIINRVVRGNGNFNLNHIGNYNDYGNWALQDKRLNVFGYGSIPQIYTLDNKIVAANTSEVPLTNTVSEMNANNKLSWKFFLDGGGYVNGEQLPSNYFTDTQFTLRGAAFTPLSADEAFIDVSGNVGCNARINEDGSISDNKDVLDTDWLIQVSLGNYTTRLTESNYVVPPIPSVSRPSGYDTDSDGMADVWEVNTFGSLAKDGTGDDDSNGYTDLEEFLNVVDDGSGSSLCNSNAPVVSLASPMSINYNEGDAINFGVSYTSDTTISAVHYYLNNSLLASTTASPFSFEKFGLAPGSYSSYAVIQDACGKISSTPSTSFAISPTNVATTLEVQACKLTTPPTIDGIEDDLWSNIPSQNMGVTQTGLAFPAPADLSANFKIAWDDSSLYFFISVTDDILFSDDTELTFFRDDAVSIFIDALDNDGVTYDSNDYYIGLKQGAPGINVNGTLYVGADFLKTDVVTSAGYDMEVKIDWSYLGITPGPNNIGLDFRVDDDDNGGARDSHVLWNDETSTLWNNPSKFGILKLTETICNTSLCDSNAPVASLASPIASDYDDNATINFNVSYTSDTTISSISYYLNNNLLRSLTASPFGFDTLGLAPGSYTSYAVVQDVCGKATNTAVISFTIGSAITIPSMADFGSIVSGYVAEDLTQSEQGDFIATWTDSFGSNHGTSTDSTKTTLNVVDGFKEVLFTGGMFDLGTASNLNFIPTVDPWTCVFQVGSVLNTTVGNIVLAIGSGSTTSRQYTIYIHYQGGGAMRPYYADKQAVSSVQVRPGDIMTVVYDPTISTNGTVTIFKNGSQEYSAELPGLPGNWNTPYHPFIGGRSNASSFDGSLRGVYVYDEALDQAAVSDIQAFLTSVPQSLIGVTVTPSSGTITVGNSEQLTTTFNPTNATDTTGVWSSSDSSIATVNASGLVTGIAAGSATITFTSNDGGFTDTYIATVEATNSVLQVQACKLVTSPIIDGTEDSLWSIIPSHIMGVTQTGHTFPAPEDLSANYKIAWDDNSLYFFISVIDDILYSDDTELTFFRDDAVSIFIDALDNDSLAYDSNDFYIGMKQGAPGININGSLYTGTDFMKSEAVTSAGYDMEVKIDWSFLGITPGPNNIGLDFRVDDDDNGGARDSHVLWNDETSTLYSNPSKFGILNLTDSTCSPVDPNVCDGNFSIPDLETTCDASTFTVPVVALNEVGAGVIGMDFCMEYDSSYMLPTGKALIGSVAHGGNPNIVGYAINTNTPGQVSGLIYFNGAAPFPSYFSGSGTVIEVEFTYNGSIVPGDNFPVSLCGASESTLYAGTIDHCVDGSAHISVVNETTFVGTLKYWDNNGKLLPYDDLNPMNNIATLITGSDSICNTNGATIYPDLNGQFTFDMSAGNYFTISRDIPGQFGDTVSCTNVMPWINGTDQNRALKIATLDPTFIPNVYQIIAADVNQDGIVNAADITLISARSVMNICGFTADGINPSSDWLFVDQTTLMTDPSFSISDSYPLSDGSGYHRGNVPSISHCLPVPSMTNGVCVSTYSEDYIAILLGDVSGNWKTMDGANLRVAATDEQGISFDFASMREEDGFYYLPLIIPSTEIEALDFYFDFNDQLSIDEVILTSTDFEVNYNVLNKNTFLYSSYRLNTKLISGVILELKISSTLPPIEADFYHGMAFVNSAPISLSTELGPQDFGTWKIYPNPVQDQLFVELPGDLSSQISISMMNLSGQIIYTELRQKDTSRKLNIPMTDLRPGIYFLEIRSENERKVYKIINE